MTAGPLRLFPRRMGQDIRAWPMLALLLLVMLTGIGCVAWFMREAIRNERLAVQGKMAELHQAQLELIRYRTIEEWNRQAARRFEAADSSAAFFAKAVRAGWADSVIVFAADGQVLYPRMDGEGRIAAANERLLALEKNPAQPALARELEEWLNDYTSPLPAPQRRFLMRELQRLAPGVDFPTLAAEDLAARYLEATPPPTPTGALRASALPGVWEAGSPDGRTLALFETDSIRQKIVALDLRQRSDKLLRLTVAAPGEDAVRDLKAAAVTLAPEFPGWKLALEPIDRSFFTAASQKRVATHLWIGSIVIAAMSVLALFVARGLGRQVQLARLKNDLVATFSHELKTPLTAMRALVDTLLDAEKFDDKTTREYLQLVAAENSRLSRLIDHFLTFSRLERNKFPFSFSRLQPQSVVEAALAAMGERRSHVTVTASPTLPEIVGDRDALVTALLNLLDNAWKYSRDDKRIALRTDAQNGRVRFAVEDHGIGITAYERRRVFDHFYRGDQRLTRTVGGCGLGLSIVRSIVAAHGGTVEVVSEVGRGSTFTIEIPAAS